MKNQPEKFIPPLFVDVYAYFIEKKYDVSLAQSFYNYYSLRDWLAIDSLSFVDWKSEVATWIEKNKTD